MKTVVVALYRVFPPVYGSPRVSWELALNLPGRKTIIELSEKDSEKEIGKRTRLISIKMERNSGMLKLKCFLPAIKKIAQKIKEAKPDYVILECTSNWMLFYFLLAKKIRKLTGAKIIHHAHNVEFELKKKENIIVALIRREFEKKLARTANLVFAVSKRDAELMQKLYGAKTLVLPNAVDIARFSAKKNEVEKAREKYKIGKKAVLFMANTGYKPNLEAAEELIEKIMPKVLEKIKDSKLLLLGGKVQAKKGFMVNPGIVSEKELVLLINASKVCVAPIRSGSGTRIKILECMAAGKPVVSTTKGAEGIEAENGKEIILEDDFGKFSSEIIELLQNSKKAERIGKNGKKLIKRRYSWNRVIGSFLKKLKGQRKWKKKAC